MTTIGIDLEQYVRDPYATGIQRVLQQLAIHWPSDIGAEFIVPHDDGQYSLLLPHQAADLLNLAFSASDAGSLRRKVVERVGRLREDRDVPLVRLGALVSLYDGWLLPEVSYLPGVLERLDIFMRSMPIAMIGYDALPMTDPGNYRFVPGVGANASEYFRRLAIADAVVCISDYARMVILDRLRRDRSLRTIVAHPGGDHVDALPRRDGEGNGRAVFLRLGTMEARKRPIEILRGFQAAARAGAQAELVFVGNANASSQTVNDEIMRAIADGYSVTWAQGASDGEVHEFVQSANVFLSIGTEGYGIPVLEALRLGTPVLFDGTQPAAELMVGKGARHAAAGTEQEMTTLFTQYSEPANLRELLAEVNPQAVPTWAAFTRRVAGAIV